MEKRPLKTLERVLSKSGLGSRTQARSWIGQGRVRVNGREIQNPDHWVDLERDKVLFDGRPLRPARKRYLLLHKPAGYITTFKDTHGRPTVYDLLGDIGTFVAPVGRLDLDTSGLLLLTNDTALAERLTNPDHKIAKTYLVKAATPLSDEQLAQLRTGVELKDGPTRPAVVRRESPGTFSISITEGRNRQVRRMVEAVGSAVVALTRTSIGNLSLGDLPSGAWRDLARAEVESLKPR
jgi:23S rRNA pseudouridine2605 synthase